MSVDGTSEKDVKELNKLLPTELDDERRDKNKLPPKEMSGYDISNGYNKTFICRDNRCYDIASYIISRDGYQNHIFNKLIYKSKKLNKFLGITFNKNINVNYDSKLLELIKYIQRQNKNNPNLGQYSRETKDKNCNTESDTESDTSSTDVLKIQSKKEIKKKHDEPIVNVKNNPIIKPKTEPKIELKTDAKIEPITKPKNEPKIEQKVEHIVKPKTEPKIEQKIEHIVKPTTEPKIESKSKLKIEQLCEEKAPPIEPTIITLISGLNLYNQLTNRIIEFKNNNTYNKEKVLDKLKDIINDIFE